MYNIFSKAKLFSSGRLSEALERKQGKLIQEIKENPPEAILNDKEEELFSSFFEKYRIEPPRLNENGITQLEPQTVEIG